MNKLLPIALVLFVLSFVSTLTFQTATSSTFSSPHNNVIWRVNVSSSGQQGNAYSSNERYAISADGRYIAFASGATNLVETDTNSQRDIFVHDRNTSTTERVSISSLGEQTNEHSQFASISADGRFVVFESLASNLVPGDVNGATDIFVHDRTTHTTERMSISSTGEEGNNESHSPTISGDGRFVAFHSSASNLVDNDTNVTWDIFVYDRQTAIMERVSVSTTNQQSNGFSFDAHISFDASHIVFYSEADNLITTDTNQRADTFVHIRLTGETKRVSISSTGEEGNEDSFTGSLSANGQFVTFTSSATNLVPNDTNNYADLFVHDQQTGITERVNINSEGQQSNGGHSIGAISADGRYVTFHSWASNLVTCDMRGQIDVFVHDRQTHLTERVSINGIGDETDGDNFSPAISNNGQYVVFTSFANNLVYGDTNNTADIFVRDISNFIFATPTPAPTPTPCTTPLGTPVTPLPTSTLPTPGLTPKPSFTPAATDTPLPTNTITPSPTSTPTNTPTFTGTPTPTHTPQPNHSIYLPISLKRQ